MVSHEIIEELYNDPDVQYEFAEKFFEDNKHDDPIAIIDILVEYMFECKEEDFASDFTLFCEEKAVEKVVSEEEHRFEAMRDDLFETGERI
jgi:hypothetical protein